MNKWLVLTWVVWAALVGGTASSSSVKRHKNAYATMMYMGTPRDYEYYVATRVMLRSLSSLGVQADLVVIASMDVPLRWIQALEQEDGAKVVGVENMKNPYKKQRNFDKRFMLTLNKIYAWRLVEYERVVMLDSDNLFLEKTDELFQCGRFCAVFINPCIFHTGLFVLRPSAEVFDLMVRGLTNGTLRNPDGADQGFLGAFFPDLLDQPMFHPPPHGAPPLNATYRLPLGYQMDASYYYLKLRWSVPCGPNSVITFPGAPWMKPWYWWSWPVLPLGISWHERRRRTLGYAEEMAAVAVQAVVYAATLIASRLIASGHWRRVNTGKSGVVVAVWSLVVAYAVPFLVVPRTVHPVLGWGLYLLGSYALSSISTNAFLLPALAVMVPWMGIVGALFVMAFPWYPNGIVRALSVFAYAFVCAPFVWLSIVKVVTQRLPDSSSSFTSNKLY